MSKNLLREWVLNNMLMGLPQHHVCVWRGEAEREEFETLRWVQRSFNQLCLITTQFSWGETQSCEYPVIFTRAER